MRLYRREANVLISHPQNEWVLLYSCWQDHIRMSRFIVNCVGTVDHLNCLLNFGSSSFKVFI